MEIKKSITNNFFDEWIVLQWTINGDEFTVEDLISSLSIGIEKGFINPKDKKEIPK